MVALLLLVQCAFASLSVVGKVTVAVVPWPAMMLARTLGALAVFIGRPIWMALQHGPGRVVDAAAGALVSAVAGLIVFWLVAAMVASFPSPTLSSAVRSSALLKQVERMAPAQASDLAYSVRRFLAHKSYPPQLCLYAGN